MASSGYTAITFVADELLTSTKMNLMAANDAAFNSGNGFEDGVIVARHLGLTAVGATKINFSTFGNAFATNAAQVTCTTAPTTLASITVAIAGTYLLVASYSGYGTTTTYAYVNIFKGAALIANAASGIISGNPGDMTSVVMAQATLAVGDIVYIKGYAGTGTVTCGATKAGLAAIRIG